MAASASVVGRGSRTRRVLVAGGRQLLRDGIHALLRTAPDVDVVGHASDPLAVRAAVAGGDVEVVVTHAFLGDASGGALVATALREESPATGVVLLLGEGEAAEVHTVLDQGTQRRALLLMDHRRCADDLVRAVHEVADGGSVVHPGVVDLIVRQRRADQSGAPSRLTSREREVLRVIATGASNRGIAATLAMSERAVEKHINRVYAKLGLGMETDVHRRVVAAIRYLAAPDDC